MQRSTHYKLLHRLTVIIVHRCVVIVRTIPNTMNLEKLILRCARILANTNTLIGGYHASSSR